MARIFITNSTDTPHATRRLAAYLEAQGHAVLWDDGGLPDDADRLGVDAADAVIAVWSPSAIDAERVLDAAKRAEQQRKLVSVLAPGVTIAALPTEARGAVPLDDPRSVLGAVESIAKARSGRRGRRSVAGRLLRATAALLLIGAVGVGGAFGFYQYSLHGSGPTGAETVVSVPRGASLNDIATELKRAGVISSAWMFVFAAKAQGVAANLKAGDYEFEPGASMAHVLSKIADGDSVRHAVRVIEGVTTYEVVAIVNAEELLTGEITDIPGEGRIAPNTYFIQPGEDRQAVIDRMVAAQDRILADAWEARAPDLPYATPEEALTMASIIEKETGLDGERRLVASVFVNRLTADNPWKLQSDPTVVYGITLGQRPLGRAITRSDLRSETPYNTYNIEGLPPGPIANPGREAIEAALNPDQSEYFFFVANGTGGHTFSRTLAEHNRAVAAWREIERQRRAN